ncbi:unnamed protein product [Brachionus calyciflorus]|uniref:Uncharacterized protein n=1 Tax=Brachionus calyciflorus TaxID=104777 RepID=A0A814DJZ1_9BILA|nr:unnamed protein product [Brachionus calyciflorus]
MFYKEKDSFVWNRLKFSNERVYVDELLKHPTGDIFTLFTTDFNSRHNKIFHFDFLQDDRLSHHTQPNYEKDKNDLPNDLSELFDLKINDVVFNEKKAQLNYSLSFKQSNQIKLNKYFITIRDTNGSYLENVDLNLKPMNNQQTEFKVENFKNESIYFGIIWANITFTDNNRSHSINISHNIKLLNENENYGEYNITSTKPVQDLND